MKHIIKISRFVLILLLFTSCDGLLNQQPQVQFTSKNAYETVEGYKSVMSGVFFNFSGGDSSFSGLRLYFNMQSLPTDESIYSWVSDNFDDVQKMKWTAMDIPTSSLFYDNYKTIALCNEFLRNATNEQISRFSEVDQKTIIGYRNDVRFVRAIMWLRQLDLFGGNIPFVTEQDAVGAFEPDPTTNAALFAYIESELKAIGDELPDNGQNEYARASKGAAWALLARLYLNAETYIKAPKYSECIEYCNRVMTQGFSLESNYKLLFNADNHKRTNEIIFPIAYDMDHSEIWSGSVYIIAGSLTGTANPATYGVSGAWGNIRSRSEAVLLFPDYSGTTDKRAIYHTDGQNLEVNTTTNSQDGYLYVKFNNLKDDGSAAMGYNTTGASTDFPMIRLSEIYLTYAEAVLRGGNGGNRTTALNLVNDIRTRAWGGSLEGNISDNQLTLDWLLEERGRELMWECHRRTDLIRYNRFAGSNYLWSWKGGVKNGQATDLKFNIYPIPSTELSANRKLTQNPGY